MGSHLDTSEPGHHYIPKDSRTTSKRRNTVSNPLPGVAPTLIWPSQTAPCSAVPATLFPFYSSGLSVAQIYGLQTLGLIPQLNGLSYSHSGQSRPVSPHRGRQQLSRSPDTRLERGHGNKTKSGPF